MVRNRVVGAVLGELIDTVSPDKKGLLSNSNFIKTIYSSNLCYICLTKLEGSVTNQRCYLELTLLSAINVDTCFIQIVYSSGALSIKKIGGDGWLKVYKDSNNKIYAEIQSSSQLSIRSLASANMDFDLETKLADSTGLTLIE